MLIMLTRTRAPTAITCWPATPCTQPTAARSHRTLRSRLAGPIDRTARPHPDSDQRERWTVAAGRAGQATSSTGRGRTDATLRSARPCSGGRLPRRRAYGMNLTRGARALSSKVARSNTAHLKDSRATLPASSAALPRTPQQALSPESRSLGDQEGAHCSSPPAPTLLPQPPSPACASTARACVPSQQGQCGRGAFLRSLVGHGAPRTLPCRPPPCPSQEAARTQRCRHSEEGGPPGDLRC